jgi:lipoate-protein ligase A
LNINDFIQFVIDVQLERNENTFYELNETDNQKIEILVNEKFKNRDWNFGYSPKYTFKNKVEIEGKTISIELNTKRGIIEKCKISGDYFSVEIAESLSAQLRNKMHLFEDVKETLKELDIYVSDNLVYCFF